MASSYGGLAGAVVRHFARISTVFTAIPTLFLLLVLIVGLQLLAHKLSIPTPFPVLLGIISVAPVTGRFGLAARRADIEAGFFAAGMTEGLFAFMIRYASLVMAWGLPLGLLTMALFSNEAFAMVGPFSMFSGFGSAKAVLLGLVMLVVVVLWIFLPTISLIICLSSDELSSIYSLDAWRWLFVNRRGDLTVFYASGLGGMCVFLAVAFPCLALFDALLFAIQERAGTLFAPAIVGLPSAGSAIFVGKLAGAFVAAEHLQPLEQHAETLPTTSVAREASGSVSEVQPTGSEGTLHQVNNLVRAVRETTAPSVEQVREFITHGEALKEKLPNHAGLLAALSTLYMRAGEHAQAMAVGTTALALALDTGSNPLAAHIYQTLRSERDHLPLKGEQWERLGRVLTFQKRLSDAVWCFTMAGQRGAEARGVKKGIIAAADSAAKADNPKEALAYYDYFLKKFPDSPFCEYCERAARRLRNLP